MVSRLGLVVMLSKEEERQTEINEAHRLKASGFSIRNICIAMNKTIGQVQRLLKNITVSVTVGSVV